MDSSGSASSYKLQLALAALVGASSAAVAAYYLHYRAVAQVARSAPTNRRRTRPPAAAGGKLPPPRRAAVGSASLPDLSAFYDAGGHGGGGLASGGYLVEEEEEDDAHGVVGPHANGGALERAELLDIPQGLPRLNVGPDGSKQFARTVSTRRVEIIRPKSPKSPSTSASALKSADGSGDAIQNSDNGYMNTNGNLVDFSALGERENLGLRTTKKESRKKKS